MRLADVREQPPIASSAKLPALRLNQTLQGLSWSFQLMHKALTYFSDFSDLFETQVPNGDVSIYNSVNAGCLPW